MPEVIADTSPLQYLHQTDLLDLLPALYSRIIIPQAVARELAEGRTHGIRLPDIATLAWVEIRAVREQALLALAPSLGAGEREVLALAVQIPDSLTLLDDALARQHARLLRVTFTGTLGVLLRAKQLGRLPAVAPILAQLESLRFRLDPITRANVLQLASEQEEA